MDQIDTALIVCTLVGLGVGFGLGYAAANLRRHDDQAWSRGWVAGVVAATEDDHEATMQRWVAQLEGRVSLGPRKPTLRVVK